MKSLQLIFMIIVSAFFSQNASAITISGNISFPNSESVTSFTRNVLVIAENPLNITQNQILTVPFNIGQQSRSYAITLPNNGHNWRVRYQCTLCNQEGVLTSAYVGSNGMVTLADQARILPGNQDSFGVDIDLISGIIFSGTISFPAGLPATAFTSNVLVVAENPLNITQNQILNIPFNIGQESRGYELTLPDNGHDWRIRYQCTLCNQEGILTSAYVGIDGMVTLASAAQIFSGNQNLTNVDIDLISSTSISGTISFPDSESVTAFTRNVLIVAENPLNITQNQILNVPFDENQQSRSYELTLPNNGHDWRIKYVCTLCNQEGVLTTAYVGSNGMVTQSEQARIFPGGQNITNINIDLISGNSISGNISFPNSDSVTAFTRNVLVFAQNPLNPAQNQILSVPFNLGQQSRSYELVLPDNGHNWIISYQCTLCNQEGILTNAYVGEEGMVTLIEQAIIFPSGQNIPNINIDLISGITFSGNISFPNSASVTNFTRNVLVVAQDPLNITENQILAVNFNLGQQSRDYSINLPSNGNDWIISYQCTLCNEEGVLTSAYVGQEGMVTVRNQARVFSGEQSLSDINILLIGEGVSTNPNDIEPSNLLPIILLQLLEEE